MDLDLHIGSVLHLELPPGGEKSVVRLIGMVPGSSLLVTAPETGAGELLSVAQGDAVGARVYAGDDVIAFVTRVQRTCPSPFPYLHLRYPESTESTPMRHARRARVHLLGTAETDQAPGKEVPITLHDISTLGAMVWAELPLGEVGEAMVLRLPLDPDPVAAHVAELTCEIRNTHDDHGPPKRRWGYGVEFGSMSSATALALRTLVMRELARR